MAKWIVEAELRYAPRETTKEKSVRKVYVRDATAKAFVLAMSSEGYWISVRTHDGVDHPMKFGES
jgi:hypothetical protein